MAKRRRLGPAQVDYLASDAAVSAPAPVETKSPFPTVPLSPIAQVAGDAAATAGLREVAAELAAARSEGRMLLRLPLDAIDAGHLVRDRIVLDDVEMAALRDSIRARGQQTPIEVVDLGLQAGTGPRYGLISGWRRLSVLQALAAEPDGGKFGSVLALLRRPESAADAYLAMVEENEIRVGLSYYERARIAARAASLGVHASPQAAIRALFPTASRAKRSKIGSFLAIHEALDDVLRFASAIPERLGLALSHALGNDPTLAGRLAAALPSAQTETQELALLTKAVAGPDRKKDPVSGKKDSVSASAESDDCVAPGLWLRLSDGPKPQVTLYGPAVDAAFAARLRAWVQAEGGAI